MPCWLAGVVHGSCTVHSWRRWVPESTHRRSVGIVPDCSAHWATGNGTPSSCTNTTPSISGSGTARCDAKARSAAVKASGVAAVSSHADQGADRGRDPGGGEGPEGGHVDAGGTSQRQVHDDGLTGDREDGNGQPAEPSGHPNHERTHDDADSSDTAAVDEERPHTGRSEAGQEFDGRREREGRDEPGHDHAREVRQAETCHTPTL